MTKEELLNSVNPMDSIESMRLKNNLDKFFESNVVIHKGTNRHQFADVLHEWIEDTTKELQEYYDVNGDDGWEQVGTEVLLGTYRIKLDEG